MCGEVGGVRRSDVDEELVGGREMSMRRGVRV
jgi:hypothetical protein